MARTGCEGPPVVCAYLPMALPGAFASPPGGILVKCSVSLPDRPGSLARFAGAIAQAGGTITFFHYDRSLDACRISAEARFRNDQALTDLGASFEEVSFVAGLSPSAVAAEVFVTAPESVLELTVRLVNEAGALAAFATLLAAGHANVIYMLYNEMLDPESVDIALATASPGEITGLLQALNEHAYHYRVLYRGSGEEEAAGIIGLKLVEKFFLRLKRLLPESDGAEIRSLVASSQEIHKDLVEFAGEAGNDLEAGDVYETVLSLASRSRSSVGDAFQAVEMPGLLLPGGVALTGLRLPTSENIYLFASAGELTLIDAGHGIYYADVKKLLRAKGLDPSRVRRIFVTHPDTDHAGTSGYFADEFGTEVFLHAQSAAVIATMNRAHGSSGGLLDLNKYYTRLSSRFTECRFPAQPRYFGASDAATIGGFAVIDSFTIGPLRFAVLESRGGHTPGLVFFLNRELGLLFCSDYLLNRASLRQQDREHLGLYRDLLVSPNQDARLYREETAALKELMLELDGDLVRSGASALIFPGHGDYYPAANLRDE